MAEIENKEITGVEVHSNYSGSDTHEDHEYIEKYLIDFGRPWYKVRGLLKLNFWLFIITFASVSSGYDGSLLNGLQSLSQWSPYFGNPSGGRLGVLSSGVSLGCIVVTFRISDIVSDRLGRRLTLGLGQVLLVIGAIVQGSSQNFAAFFIARFIIGLAYIGAVAAPLLIAELAYPSHRSIATASYNTTWYMGALLASTITYGTYVHLASDDNYAWRIPSYLQGVFGLVNIALLKWTPESPRFLINKGRIDEARDLLIKYHADGNVELGSDLVEFEIKQIEIALEYEKISKNTTFSAFFKTKANFHRLFICAFIGFMMNFSGNALVSYYLTLVLDSIGITEKRRQLEINIWLMFFNYIVSLISAYLTSKLKRRFMFLTSTISMLTAYIIWTILSAINQKTDFEHKSLGNGVLSMIFIFYAAYNFALNVLPATYASEILPYNLRAKGYNVLQFVCIAGNIFNAFVNPIAMANIEWKYYIFYCCMLAVEVTVVYFTFVETFGYTLEEVSELVFKENVLTTVGEINIDSSEDVQTKKIETGPENGKSYVQAITHFPEYH